MFGNYPKNVHAGIHKMAEKLNKDAVYRAAKPKEKDYLLTPIEI
jgi:hypothetical protein